MIHSFYLQIIFNPVLCSSNISLISLIRVMYQGHRAMVERALGLNLAFITY